ncbi:MAG: PEP-CTERM sorting domain-containing protein [Gammaproteobacteria bacterium]|nr:PEP-CTERM sorting domain-containing protein [Gammaproteobacteria bacterium]
MKLNTSILLLLAACSSTASFARVDTVIQVNSEDTHNVLNNQAFDVFDASNGWALLTDDDGGTDPGWGGQNFDAEYLFYKYDSASNNMSIALQTGFDLDTGTIDYKGKRYDAGDLALSFDGDVSKPGYKDWGNDKKFDVAADGTGYEYAVDFGLETKNYYGQKVEADNNNDGMDTAGFYQVDTWNNGIYYAATSASGQGSTNNSAPFAMDEGTLVASLSQNAVNADLGASQYSDGHNSYGSNSKLYKEDRSYFRVVTFNLDNIVTAGNSFTVDAHWTMSCGNDAINGRVQIGQSNNNPVPEPSIVGLMAIGSIGVIASGLRRKKSATLVEDTEK